MATGQLNAFFFLQFIETDNAIAVFLIARKAINKFFTASLWIRLWLFRHSKEKPERCSEGGHAKRLVSKEWTKSPVKEAFLTRWTGTLCSHLFWVNDSMGDMDRPSINKDGHSLQSLSWHLSGLRSLCRKRVRSHVFPCELRLNLGWPIVIICLFLAYHLRSCRLFFNEFRLTTLTNDVLCDNTVLSLDADHFSPCVVALVAGKSSVYHAITRNNR